MKNRVEFLRKERNLTQEELAIHLKVSRQTVSSIENERYTPSLLLAYTIAGFFDKKVEEVFINDK